MSSILGNKGISLHHGFHVSGLKAREFSQLSRSREANQNRNSTFSTTTPGTYWDYYNNIAGHSSQLNVAERLWAAWYAWMQNDVLATGIMSFVMHELVYFGRSLPWILIDTLGFFKNYKIQSVSHYPIGHDMIVCTHSVRARFPLYGNSGTVPNSSF